MFQYKLNLLTNTEKQKIQMELLWKQAWVEDPLLLGEVFNLLVIFSKLARLICRIEDGALVRIWKDMWLPIPTTYSVQSPRTIFSRAIIFYILVT